MRTTGAYGAVFGVFFKQKLAGKPFTVVGDGTQRRDFLYVTDVAEAFRLAAETRHTGQVWNLGAGNPQSVNRLVDLLGGDKVFIPKRPGEPDCTWADISKITRDLGWKPRVSFEDGVAHDAEGDRRLAGCAALGPGIDRPRDPHLVSISRQATRRHDSLAHPTSTATRSRPSTSC